MNREWRGSETGRRGRRGFGSDGGNDLDGGDDCSGDAHIDDKEEDGKEWIGEGVKFRRRVFSLF